MCTGTVSDVQLRYSKNTLSNVPTAVIIILHFVSQLLACAACVVAWPSGVAFTAARAIVALLLVSLSPKKVLGPSAIHFVVFGRLSLTRSKMDKVLRKYLSPAVVEKVYRRLASSTFSKSHVSNCFCPFGFIIRFVRRPCSDLKIQTSSSKFCHGIGNTTKWPESRVSAILPLARKPPLPFPPASRRMTSITPTSILVIPEI